jgi:hypothetical protein
MLPIPAWAPNIATLKGVPSLEGMKDWLLRLGHEVCAIYLYTETTYTVGLDQRYR